MVSALLIVPVAFSAAIAMPAWRFACRNVQAPVEVHDELRTKLRKRFAPRRNSFAWRAVPAGAAFLQVRRSPLAWVWFCVS